MILCSGQSVQMPWQTNSAPRLISLSCRDRFRTSVNILGDAYGAAIVHKLSLADLQQMDGAESRGEETTDGSPRPSGRGSGSTGNRRSSRLTGLAQALREKFSSYTTTTRSTAISSGYTTSPTPPSQPPDLSHPPGLSAGTLQPLDEGQKLHRSTIRRSYTSID